MFKLAAYSGEVDNIGVIHMRKTAPFLVLTAAACAVSFLVTTVESQASRSGNAQHCIWHRVQAQLASQKGETRKAQFHWRQLRLCQAGRID